MRRETSNREAGQEGALADDEAEIVRLLEAINGHGPAEFFKRSVLSDATEWVRRTLRFGANIGLGVEVSAPILFDALNEIHSIVAARIERERFEGPPRENG
jgi:hypothetical protein